MHPPARAGRRGTDFREARQTVPARDPSPRLKRVNRYPGRAPISIIDEGGEHESAMSAERTSLEVKARLPFFGVAGALAALLFAATASAQPDPERRDLVQIGYGQPLGGHPPLAAYGYYYLSRPDFLRPGLGFRVVVAPTYLDAELGVKGAFGPTTDLSVGLS